MVKSIKLAKMAGVMHEADHAYDYAYDHDHDHACVINLPCIFLPITWSCRIFSFNL